MPTTPANSTTTSTMSNLIQVAYDKYIEFNLRSEPMFRKFADKKPVDVTNPGNTVVFQVYTDLSRVTSALTQTQDPDAVTLNNTNKVNVTVDEYGNSVLTTERLALESLSAIDPAVADMLSFNMRDSLMHSCGLSSQVLQQVASQEQLLLTNQPSTEKMFLHQLQLHTSQLPLLARQ